MVLRATPQTAGSASPLFLSHSKLGIYPPILLPSTLVFTCKTYRRYSCIALPPRNSTESSLRFLFQLATSPRRLRVHRDTQKAVFHLLFPCATTHNFGNGRSCPSASGVSCLSVLLFKSGNSWHIGEGSSPFRCTNKCRHIVRSPCMVMHLRAIGCMR